MVHEILSRGAENALSGTDICSMLNISRRELSQIVESERRKGAPICASTDHNQPGYFLAADRAEMERYCRSLFHRAGELHKTRKACLESMDKIPEAETDPPEIQAKQDPN